MTDSSPTLGASAFDIRFHTAADDLTQDRESFEFKYNGENRELRIHDYAELYRIPGLYEALVYDALKCASPPRLASLLADVVRDWPITAEELRVLDLGAGNGIVAEELRKVGVGHIVGLDLLPEAKMAAERDRPKAYDDFVVADLTSLSPDDETRLERARFNALVTAAALGFGDIPPTAFRTAFNYVCDGGWLAMTIKEDFIDPEGDDSGFARMLRHAIADDIIDIQAHLRYCHRLSIDGEQLFYVALIARKTSDIPASFDETADVVTFPRDGAAALLKSRR